MRAQIRRISVYFGRFRPKRILECIIHTTEVHERFEIVLLAGFDCTYRRVVKKFSCKKLIRSFHKLCS